MYEVLMLVFDCFVMLVLLYDVVVLLDYGKGGFMYVGKMIEMLCYVGCCVLVDLKGDDYLCYKGVIMIMFNCVEMCQVVGLWKFEQDFIICV